MEYIKDWRCRAQGLAGLVLSGIFLYNGIKYNEPIITAGGVLFGIEGVGDAITGYHHYCGQKAIDGVKYIIKKIKNQHGRKKSS